MKLAGVRGGVVGWDILLFHILEWSGELTENPHSVAAWGPAFIDVVVATHNT